MSKIYHPSLYATVAISAALAFGSTSASGQGKIDPTIQLPPVSAPMAAEAAAPEPLPTIVVPQMAPITEAPAETAPATSPTSQTEPSKKPAAARTEKPAAVSAASRTRSNPPAMSEIPAESTELLQPVPVTADAGPITAAPAEPERTRNTVQRSVDMPDELLGAAGLGVLALGAIGLVNLRRRRKRDAEAQAYEPSPVLEASWNRPAPLPTSQGTAGIDSADAAPFAMPAGPVPTGEERQELIRRMVAMPPDKANPFTTPKARRRRARTILQRRERLWREKESQPFDWRTYQPSPNPTSPAELIDA